MKYKIRDALVHLLYLIPLHCICDKNESQLVQYINNLDVSLRKQLLTIVKRLRSENAKLKMHQFLKEYFGSGAFTLYIQPALSFVQQTLDITKPNDEFNFVNMQLLLWKHYAKLNKISKQRKRRFINSNIEHKKHTTITPKKRIHPKKMFLINDLSLLDFEFVAQSFLEILCNFDYVQEIGIETVIKSEFQDHASHLEIQLMIALAKVFAEENKIQIHLPVKKATDIKSLKWPPPEEIDLDKEENWWAREGYPTIEVPFWARRIGEKERPKEIVYPPIEEFFFE